MKEKKLFTKLVGTNSPIALIDYLKGPGKENEHTNPHIIASSSDLGLLPGQILSDETWSDVAFQMQETSDLYGRGRKILLPKAKSPGVEERASFGHLIISLDESDGSLKDDVWQDIVQEHLSSVGLDNCQWVAINHGKSLNGNDHVHVVINMVETANKSLTELMDCNCRMWSSYRWKAKLRDTSDRMEQKYGLVKIKEINNGKEIIYDDMNDISHARRNNSPISVRQELANEIRIAATISSSEKEFVSHNHYLSTHNAKH